MLFSFTGWRFVQNFNCKKRVAMSSMQHIFCDTSWQNLTLWNCRVLWWICHFFTFWSSPSIAIVPPGLLWWEWWAKWRKGSSPNAWEEVQSQNGGSSPFQLHLKQHRPTFQCHVGGRAQLADQVFLNWPFGSLPMQRRMQLNGQPNLLSGHLPHFSCNPQ